MPNIRRYYFSSEGIIIDTVRASRHTRAAENWILCCRTNNTKKARAQFNKWAKGWWRKQEKEYYHSVVKTEPKYDFWQQI